MIEVQFRSGSRLAGLLLMLMLVLAFPLISVADFYDQKPMTEAELLKFIDDMPHYLAWARQHNEQAHPSLDEQGRPAFAYSAAAAARVEQMGWKAERFFCVMGRTAAALALGGRKATRDKPVDMPMVSPAELNLVRRHMDALETLGN